ncbi:MAG: putative transposase [Candidatus Brocadiia bacterium]
MLCAVPALLAAGLLDHLEGCFQKLDGYYQRLHIFLLLAYMALWHMRCAERLRFEPPGELGKVMGLRSGARGAVPARENGRTEPEGPGPEVACAS